MTFVSAYNDTNSTIYPDGFARERIFRTSGDMLSPAPPRDDAPGLLARVFEMVAHWRMKRAGRLVLRDLTDVQLLDIGVTRAQAAAEVRKSLFVD